MENNKNLKMENTKIDSTIINNIKEALKILNVLEVSDYDVMDDTAKQSTFELIYCTKVCILGLFREDTSIEFFVKNLTSYKDLIKSKVNFEITSIKYISYIIENDSCIVFSMGCNKAL